MPEITIKHDTNDLIVGLGSDAAEASRQAGLAESSANAAEVAAAHAESMTGPTYASTAAGLAATSDGQGFAVDNGDGTVTIYRNVAGAAVEQRKLFTTEFANSTAGAGGVGTTDGVTVQQKLDTQDATLSTATANITNLQAGAANVAWDNLTFPQYAAHRGMEMSFPENTLLAYQETFKAGGRILELDAYLTASGDLVCMHDTTTARTVRDPSGAAITLTTENLTSQDLYGLDASYQTNTGIGFFGSDFTGNKPPLLDEVFVEMRGKVAFMVEAKGSSAANQKACAEAIAALAENYNMAASVVIQVAFIDNAVDLKTCKVAYINTGGKQTPAALANLVAEGYYMTIEPKANIDAGYKADVAAAGLVLSGYTYTRPDELTVVPDVPICVDIFVCQEKRLSTAQDYLQRTYPGPGYIREGFGGGNPGNAPICYPVIRDIAGQKFIGWDSAHPSLTTGRNRFGIANLDPDPDNDDTYTLDFDFIWTELTASTNELSVIFFEMDKASTFQEGAASSVVKNAYGFGFRANGGANLYRFTDVGSGSAAAVASLASASGLPNPPTVNTVYPCRVAVTPSNMTITFDVGGLNITMTSADTTHRGGKYLQLERRGHGFMIADLRRS